MNSTGEDITKYVEEMRDNFIAEENSIDDEWDDYVNTLEKMGLEEYVENKAAALERYEAAD